MPLSLINTDFSFFEIKNAISFMLNRRSLKIDDLDSIISEFFEDQNVALFPKLRYGMQASFESFGLNNNLIGVPTFTCSVVPHAVVKSDNRIRYFDTNKNNLTTEIFDNDVDIGLVTPWYGSPLNSKTNSEVNTFGDYSHISFLENNLFNSKNHHITFYSTGIGKPISSISGGIVAVNDRNILTNIKKWRKDNDFGKLSNIEISELILTLSGAFLNSLKMDALKIYADNRGWLDFLREPLDKISFGKYKNNYSKYSFGILQSKIKSSNPDRNDVVNTWKSIFENTTIKVLNESDWSNSHLNLLSDQREKLIKSMYVNHKIQLKKGSDYLCHELEPYKNSSEKNSYDNARFFKDNLVQIPIDLNFSEVEWLNKNKLDIKSNTIKHF